MQSAYDPIDCPIGGRVLPKITSQLPDLATQRRYRKWRLQGRPINGLADWFRIDPDRMLQEWTTHYPVTLRPKLVLGQFHADLDRLQKLDMEQLKADWGGEPAAEQLTGYLKPAQFTVYTSEPIARLVAAGRMRAEPTGNVEVLEKFWNFSTHFDNKHVVPPILVYADLLATGDGRNAEAARLIYDQQIVSGFGDAA